MFEPVVNDEMPAAVIKVFGVGGAGGNAVNHMVTKVKTASIADDIYHNNDEAISGVEFFVVNTDIQALKKSLVQNTIQIGAEVTKGLGAGARPEIGRASAEEDREAIRNAIRGADMVFIAAGMGGGTGTGAAPVIAEVSKEEHILTVAVVTKPFGFEGRKRMQNAEKGIGELSKYVDSLIVIPNEKLLKVLGKNITLTAAFAEANNVLLNAVRGISDMITSPGLINLDFADVRTVMSEMGRAMMGNGIAQGEAGSGRAEEAAQKAVASPLLDDIDLTGARGVLVNVTSGLDLTLDEFNIVGDTVRAFAAEDADVVVGSSLLPELENEIRVTIVATGIGDKERLTVLQGQENVNSLNSNPPIAGFPGLDENYRPPKLDGSDEHSALYGRKMTVGSDVREDSPAIKDKKDLINIPAYIRDTAD